MRIILSTILSLCIVYIATADIQHTESQLSFDELELLKEILDSISENEEPQDTIKVLTLEEILASIPPVEYDKDVDIYACSPFVFSRYQPYIKREIKSVVPELSVKAYDSIQNLSTRSNNPNYFENKIKRFRLASDIRHRLMVENPVSIEYMLWKLPIPKTMTGLNEAAENLAYNGEPTTNPITDELEKIKQERRYWLHKFDGGVQFSQAYLSPNWYQGGNNNLSLIVNFLWNVKLNEVYNPNLLFENNVQYKLGLYSTPQDECHKYSISEDLFQWNLKAGFKAFKKWFYSFTLQFKTQLLNTYPQNSLTRTASFMSPGDLNLGVGMTYNTTNNQKTLKFNASIAPLSYNLKTCLDPAVDPTQFNIKVGKKTTSEIGSNAELTLDWTICKNINYRSRLFLFSDYSYFLSDWENTVSFSINRFLSTQIYLHIRYDSSSEISNNKWKHWQLKEILSFGFRYTFDTKI